MRTKNQRIVKRLMILGSLAVLVIALGVGLSVVRNRVKARTLQESREQGLAAYESGDLDLAAEKLGYYHATKNDDPDVAYKLADASMRLPSQGNEGLRSAALFAKRAADLAPTRTEPLELLVEIFGLLNQQTERLDAAERLLELDPASTIALDAKARALVAMGRRDEALEAANELTAITPDDPEGHRLVFAILSTEEPTIGRTKMAEYVKKLGESHPDDARFTVLRIHATALMGDLNTAREIAATMTDADLDARTLGEMMRSFDLLGMREAGDELLARHADKPDMLRAVSVLGVQRQFMRGQLDRATETAKRALETPGAASADLLPWAMACGLEIADDRYAEILAESEFNTSYHEVMREGFLALANRDPVSARSAFSAALNIRREDPLAGALLADAMDRIGAWKDAALERRDVLRKTPEFTTVRLAHVDALMMRGRPVEADAAVRDGLELDPSNGALLLAHILCVAEMTSTGVSYPEEVRGAVRLARAMEGETDEVTPVTIPLARLLVAMGDRPDLATTLDRITRADINTINLRALMSLAEAIEAAGLPRAGELYAMIDQAERIDPYIILERATDMADDGDSQQGLALMDRKLEQARQSSEQLALQMEMARAAYLDRTADSTAIEAIRALASANPGNAAVQTLVLESQTAWSDRQLISDAVSRLRTITGDDSTGWRLHEARRMLVFDPTAQSAAAVINLLDNENPAESADPVSELVLADAMSILGDARASADHLERAIDAGLDSPALVLRLISIRQSMGEIDNARRRAIALTQHEPVSDQIRRERVAALIRLGLYEPAKQDADLLAQTPNARNLIIAASLSGKLGDTAETNRRLDALMALDEVQDQVLSAAALTLVEADRTRDAYLLLERHRKPKPSTDFVLAEATLMESTGRPEDAAEVLAQAVRTNNDAELFTAQAGLLARLGRIDQAKAACDAGLAQAPSNQQLLLLKEAIGLVSAQHSSSIGEDAQAARRVIEALRANTVESSNPAELVRQLRVITEEQPTFYPGWSVLTAQLQSQARYEEAAETALTAMRIMPGDPRPARLAVDALLLINEPRRALAAADEWSRRSKPDSYQADTTMAALHIRLGSPTNASQVLEPWVERIQGDPDAAPILVRLLAAVDILQGNQAGAWELIKPRVDRNPQWLAHAIEISRDLIQIKAPINASVSWLDRVTNHWKPGTEDTLRIAQARMDIATATGSENDLLLTIQTLDRLRTMPGQSEWQERGGMLLRIAAERMLGRTAEAAQHARELVAARPDDTIALSMLTLATLESGGDTQQALPSATRAVQLAEQNTRDRSELTTALDALGQAQLAAGQTAEAETTFRRLLGLQSDSAMARLGLAEVFIAKDLPDEARRMVQSPGVESALERSPWIQTRVDQINRRLP